jgi:predicted hydrocarbon binding protein
MKSSFHALAEVGPLRVRALAATTMIANEIRRARRQVEGSSDVRSRIASMRRAAVPAREIQDAGRAAGLLEKVRNLADVLYSVQVNRLGRAGVVEESNQHLILRLVECACCGSGAKVDGGCAYVEGFLSGCLQATGRWDAVEVKEIECGVQAGDVCIFRAELRGRER